jgi:hypothetical protein
MFPLDFDEFLIWKEKVDVDKVEEFKQNPLNKSKIYYYLEEFLVWG